MYVAIAVMVILLLGGIGGTLGYAAYQDGQPTSPSFNLKNGQKEVPLAQKLVVSLKRPASLGNVESHFHIAPAVEACWRRLPTGAHSPGRPTGPGQTSRSTG